MAESLGGGWALNRAVFVSFGSSFEVVNKSLLWVHTLDKVVLEAKNIWLIGKWDNEIKRGSVYHSKTTTYLDNLFFMTATFSSSVFLFPFSYSQLKEIQITNCLN